MKMRLTSIEDAKDLSLYYTSNREHLQTWEPIRAAEYHTLAAWINRLKERVEEQIEEKAAYFVAYSGETKEILAVCNLTSITRGAFQSCYMGYSVAKSHEGKGVMKKLCVVAIKYAFEKLKLNRVMANHMPDNIRSAYLLSSLGFEKEGLAKKYLCINGKWEDHILNSIVNPKNF